MDTTTDTTGKPSVEHIVLGAVLVVVLAVGGWFLLKPGGSAKPTKTTAAPNFSRPSAAAQGDQPQAAPGLSLKPTTFTLVPMTRKAYLKAGNKICARMNAATKALGDFPTGTKAQAAFVTRTFTITEKARKLLVALPAPEDSAAKLASYYVVMAKADGVGKSLAKSLTAGDTAKAAALEKQLAKVSAKGNAEFNAYGLTVCGS